MQAIEALNHLVQQANDRVRYAHQLTEGRELSELEIEENKRNDLAIAICTAMMNAAIPVCRFRCFVKVESVNPVKGAFRMDRPIVGSEYTICAVDIDGIKAGLLGLASTSSEVMVSLWEQRATGADMRSGYQGKANDVKYRRWLQQIEEFQTGPTVQ